MLRKIAVSVACGVCTMSSWPAPDFSGRQFLCKLRLLYSPCPPQAEPRAFQMRTGVSPTPQELAHSLQVLSGSTRELNLPRNNFQSVREGDSGDRLRLSPVRWTPLGGTCALLPDSRGIEPLMPIDLKGQCPHWGFSCFPGSLFLLRTSAA